MSNPLIRPSVAALSPYVPGEQPRDPAVIKLNTNENPYPPAPEVMEVLARSGPDALRKYPDPVCGELRALLAEMHGCTPAQVFVGNGSDEVLALCVRAFTQPGEAVGFFEPSYSLYPVLAAIEDRPVRPVPLGPGFSWAMPDGYAAGLFFLTNPNAPTSLLFPRDRVESFCRAFGRVVVIDEAYADFAREHYADFALAGGNVLVSRTFSKSYSLAGLRLGYAIGPEPLIGALFKIKDSYNVDALAQALGCAAVRRADHMRANVARIRATRARVIAALRERGVEVLDAETNFLLLQVPGRDAREVFDGLRARNILVRHFPGPLTGDWLRVSIGRDEEMDAFLAALITE